MTKQLENSNSVDIITLPENRWREYKQLRLRALQENPEAFANSFEKESAYPDDRWQIRVKEALESKTDWMFFAQRNEQLIGLAASFLENDGSGIATIVSVFVDVEERGKGISKKIVSKLLKELKKNPQVKKIRLSVNCQQEAAIHLYESFEFQRTGEDSRLMGDKKFHKELLMELPEIKPTESE